jgi:uncharacterized DUF497 family protein
MADKLSYDSAKRAKTLAERGLDFKDASDVISGDNITYLDERLDYGRVFETSNVGGCVDTAWRVSPRHIDEESQ